MPDEHNTPTPAIPLLRLENIAISAAGTRLLEGVSFAVEAGELVALTGPSGCGKTSLLRCICGLDNAVGGDISLLGRRMEEWGWPTFRRRVLLVAQQPVLLDGSVEDNLSRPFLYHSAHEGKSGTSFPRERAVALLDRLGVGAGRLDQNARSLSIGQQQRVCLIRALLLEPLVLLLDEPTSALDADSTRAVEEVINEATGQRGLAALVVTHNAAQSEHWCRRRVDVCAYAPSPPGTATQ